MQRVLVEWRGVRVWSYPAMLYLGLVIGVYLQFHAAQTMGLPAFRVYLATLTLLPIALAGSRLLYVATHWDDFRNARHLIWKRGEGGLAMYGGVPLMLAASLAVLPLYGLTFWPFWDSAVFCIFPGMAFARIGCFLNGCCAGRPTSGRVAMWLPDGDRGYAWRIPVQPLEFLMAILLLAACWAIRDPSLQPGVLFATAVGGYGLVRLVLQPLRAERERAMRLDVQMGISVALIVFALSAFGLF